MSDLNTMRHLHTGDTIRGATIMVRRSTILTIRLGTTHRGTIHPGTMARPSLDIPS